MMFPDKARVAGSSAYASLGEFCMWSMFLCRVLFISCYETPFLTVSENILHTLLEFLNICPLKSNKKNPILEYLKNILCSNDQKHLYVFKQSHLHGRKSLLLKYFRFCVPNCKNNSPQIYSNIIYSLFKKNKNCCDTAVTQWKGQGESATVPFRNLCNYLTRAAFAPLQTALVVGRKEKENGSVKRISSTMWAG